MSETMRARRRGIPTIGGLRRVAKRRPTAPISTRRQNRERSTSCRSGSGDRTRLSRSCAGRSRRISFPRTYRGGKTASPRSGPAHRPEAKCRRSAQRGDRPVRHGRASPPVLVTAAIPAASRGASLSSRPTIARRLVHRRTHTRSSAPARPGRRLAPTPSNLLEASVPERCALRWRWAHHREEYSGAIRTGPLSWSADSTRSTSTSPPRTS